MADRAFEFKRWGATLVQWSSRVLFPPVCGGCRRLLATPGALCGACWPRLRFVERPWCEILGVPFTHEMGEGVISPEAIANPPAFARARSAVIYEGVARDMARGLKFRDRTDLAPWMARWMMRAGSELVDDADLVVPVPLHRTRFFMRRFNQSAELARNVGWLAGKPFKPEAVERIRATRQQVGLGAREREENVRGAFRVPDKMKEAVKGRRILVIDDVYTTGTTVTAVAKAFRKAGAGPVDVLTFARVLPGDFRPDDPETI